MFNSFFKIIKLLDTGQKRNFYLIILFAIIGSFFEILSVYLIGPFISILSNPQIIHEQFLIKKIYLALELDYKYFVSFCGLILCSTVFFANSMQIYMSWQSHKFGQYAGSYFSQLLFNYYLNKNYLFHKNNNSNLFNKNIIFETRRCADGVIGPVITLISKSVILLSICFSLFFIDFFTTSIIFFSLFLSYLILFIIVKKYLKNINSKLSEYENNKYTLTDTAFGGIKDIKLSFTQNLFMNFYKKITDGYAYNQSLSLILAQFPRFVFETIAVFLIVSFSLSFLYTLNSKSFAETLPFLAMYSFAGFKIMPLLQLIYFSLATIRANRNSIDIIYDDLKNQVLMVNKDHLNLKNNGTNFNFKTNFQEIKMKNINFNYQTKKIFKNLNFSIKRNEIIGIYGPSGSGKSTFIDLFTGLINFNSGSIFFDNHQTDIYENELWYNKISYLSQNIFIFDGSLLDNIIFKINSNQSSIIDINENKLNKILSLTNLKSIRGEEPKELLKTELGRSGQKISGGEKQRIGIARALYKNSDILIFDEPTSSLDPENENLFIQTIKKIYLNKFIIIISHKKETLNVCHKVYKLYNHQLNLDL